MLVRLAGRRLAGAFTDFLGTWTFIIVYCLISVTWIGLHQYKILAFDTDYKRITSWWGWFATIQASFIMMSQNRQSNIDRHRARQTFDNTQHNYEILEELNDDVEQLTSVLEALLEDEVSRKAKKGTS